jgi:hypothetical protein
MPALTALAREIQSLAGLDPQDRTEVARTIADGLDEHPLTATRGMWVQLARAVYSRALRPMPSTDEEVRGEALAVIASGPRTAGRPPVGPATPIRFPAELRAAVTAKAAAEGITDFADAVRRACEEWVAGRPDDPVTSSAPERRFYPEDADDF